MNNYGINQKTINFFKNNGKNIVCSTLAAVALMVPCKAKLECSNQEVGNTTETEEKINNQEMVFVVKTEWKKTENYSDGKGSTKENREFKRTIRRILPNDNYNEEYFNEDYDKVLKTIRDVKNINSIFDIIEEKEEVVLVSENEEKMLDQKNWSLEIEGTAIKTSIINPQLEHDIKNNVAMGLFFGTPTLLMLAYMSNSYREKRKKSR